jgi:hypothetical protein
MSQRRSFTRIKTQKAAEPHAFSPSGEALERAAEKFEEEPVNAPESAKEVAEVTGTLIELTGARNQTVAGKIMDATVKGIAKAAKIESNPPGSGLLLSVLSELGKLLESEISAQFATDNAFELARLRGEASKLELLEEAGPLLTPSQVAGALGKTKQAVHKRLQSGSLFGLINKGEFRIPAWQIREREVVPGIAQVLKNLDTTPWGKMLFLHSENMQLGDRRPADLILAGDIDLVAQVAASFGEQGAK